MENQQLGMLKRVNDLRSVWRYEETEFTTWLAQPENIALLGEEIGLNIEVQQVEAAVGGFSVDILAREQETGKIVIIENQLEKADHNHIGKLITYAAGHEAEFIIWVVKDLRDEFRQALDWLNEHTDDKINFFCVKIELWQIDNSNVAPKFQVLCQSNQWLKNFKRTTEKSKLSENTLSLLEFTNGFIEYAKSKKTSLRLGNPQPSAPAYYSIGIGSKLGSIAIKFANYRKSVRVDFYFKDKNTFLFIKDHFRQEISDLFDGEVIWDDLGNYKGAVVGSSFKFDLDYREDWVEVYDWMKNTAEKIQKNFPGFLKAVPVSFE